MPTKELETYEKLASPEYADFDTYCEILCHRASMYVESIRRIFAAKAIEMYENKTVRKLVFAYGEEVKKLDKDRQFQFKFAAKHGTEYAYFQDSCLNKADSYGDTIDLLFGIHDET